jgi:hypothetical protein
MWRGATHVLKETHSQTNQHLTTQPTNPPNKQRRKKTKQTSQETETRMRIKDVGKDTLWLQKKHEREHEKKGLPAQNNIRRKKRTANEERKGKPQGFQQTTEDLRKRGNGCPKPSCL